MRRLSRVRSKLADERGATLLTMIFFLFCLGGLLSLVLFQEQTHFLKMNVQQTADIISKGARAAGKWEYVDAEGNRQTRLFATKEEAIQSEAEIIRGAREEAEILWNDNRASLERGKLDDAHVVHQKGEKQHLYKQGIYYIWIGVETRLSSFTEDYQVKLERVSQSGTYD
ncbi:hypothetical protein EDM59_30460 [Brevibacillus nitrificans]|uniref:Uncharacterized protein n=1 Tax=Brevibacillus nitrificans TaxID=651560 RepID=A0A3M8CQ54_9BACL|nr:hypothetical protein [Brevibacillus nitrificans]RNB77794.1 hypothetical protein EDM59_30460 [Brevibacillus nitrificans]